MMGKAWLLARVLLTFSAALIIAGCAERQIHVTGASGPVAWQVTDFRIVTRSMQGTPRDLYTFTLVLQETQGTALTFQQVVSRLTHPSIPTLPQQSTILWQLRPHGELRQPFAFPLCITDACKHAAAMAPWSLDLAILGTDQRQQPLRVVINTRLPNAPTAPSLSSAVPPDEGTNPIPFETVQNHIMVRAMLNQQEYATLLLDTGAGQTFVTPDTAQRLGLSPAADTPTRTTTMVGGRQVEVPMVRLATLAIGNARRDNLPVGVLASFPQAPFFDGILGGSFLEHFTLTLDYAGSRLWLVPRGTPFMPPMVPKTTVTGSRAIPLKLASSYLLVSAVLNHTESVLLLLDTGASHTLMTPQVAQRLGIDITASTPRRTMTVADGQRQEVPVVQLTALTVGHAMVERLPVAISELFPHPSAVDGLLGMDFLGQFIVTLDRSARQMWLASRQPGKP
jgi:clan AA aspartic protease (TIGR02281 family)